MRTWPGGAGTVAGMFPISWPRVPGHEVIGRIDALGEGVQGWTMGQRVGVGFLAGSCGYCSACRAGDLIHCENQEYTGVEHDGGYAEVMIAKASGLVIVSDEPDSMAAGFSGLAFWDLPTPPPTLYLPGGRDCRSHTRDSAGIRAERPVFRRIGPGHLRQRYRAAQRIVRRAIGRRDHGQSFRRIGCVSVGRGRDAKHPRKHDLDGCIRGQHPGNDLDRRWERDRDEGGRVHSHPGPGRGSLSGLWWDDRR
jgi:hypothetical protein